MDVTEVLNSNFSIIHAERIETPSEFADCAETFSIRYRSDDFEVEGYAAIPKTFSGKLPVIIFNRGGNREFGRLIPEKVCKYAVYGYAVFGSQYRGNCGGTGQEEFGGSDVNDIINLTTIALEMPFTRNDGVFMVGHSRGGMMTYIACTRDDRIIAATVGSGIADSIMMYETREESMKDVYKELVGGAPADCPEEFYKRSAVKWAGDVKPPILICQGTDDWRVVPQQAYETDRALEKAGKEHKLIVYQGADHSLKGTSYNSDVVDWFRQHDSYLK